ncbi:hypothetical protein H6504_05200, partial [Candidatus Woesearchaeota archaeon]|nr:hypothetical protein [Candidatus Woesearchaeota archaeon]
MEFIDAYRADNRVILWMREGKENRRLVKDYRVTLYLEKHKLSYQALRRLGLPYFHATHQDYLGKYMPVLGVHISYLNNFEKIVGLIEKETQHKVLLYNADIKPEQQYVYEHGLVLGDVELSYMDLGIIASGDVRKDHNIPVHTLHIDGRQYSGAEEDVLKNLAAALKNKDPDVIFMEHAFSRVPYLLNRASLYGIRLPFHRWDESPLTYRGGKTFFSYGHIVYRDYAVRLHGRLLIDACTHIGSECRLGAIIELAQISGTLLQQVASRSFGAVFQSSLVREMIRKDYLVPFKEKPVDKPLTMFQLLKQDRVGHTLDPLVGFHTDVAEVDYASMYPWLIYHKNISIDANSEKKGIIPRAIKPFLDRRMHYKKTGDKERLQGLKWVLVSSYGYLRFREFKLGVASAHMAIGEAAREVMMDSMQYAQEQGYRVIHGIIDSLYIQKEHITDNDAITFAKDLELRHGIPVSFDGIFKWIVFLPSVTNAKRPVPTHYFGVYRNGKIKVRGIELRQR